MTNVFHKYLIFKWNLIFLVIFQIGLFGQGSIIELTPAPYNQALRNPLKGFTTRGISDHEWSTLAHSYIKWNEIENDESDDINKIIDFLDAKWKGVESSNIKLIPRIYLHWDGDKKYWPADMQSDDYSSEQFKERVLRLIHRLGIIWDTDPRVAFIEMGIFGKWGEHHSPSPSSEMQTIIANAFAEAFPNKLVSVRHSWSQFQSQSFGEYWDSWGHYDQMWPHGNRIAELNQSEARYLENYIGGEVAYNWGNSAIQPGPSPTESVADSMHRNFIINSIRWLHCTQLRWISDYDRSDMQARMGAEMIQKAFGYRYILEKVKFTSQVVNGNLQVGFEVLNEGSAPFYYNWPVEVSLLDTATQEVVWSDTFKDVDIREWLPGEGWDPPDWTKVSNWSQYYPDTMWSSTIPLWSIQPDSYYESANFQVEAPDGKYILALAVLDPAGLLPSLRFATDQYFNGGRHPIGLVAVNEGQGGQLPAGLTFDDPAKDNGLHYLYQGISLGSNKVEKVNVFPNPAQNNITIVPESGDITRLEIFDIYGRMVFQKSLKDYKSNIDVSGFPAGLYLLRINSQIIKKIIIQ